MQLKPEPSSPNVDNTLSLPALYIRRFQLSMVSFDVIASSKNIKESNSKFSVLHILLYT